MATAKQMTPRLRTEPPTPVQTHGGWLVKRDDLYDVGGSKGGKVRTCAALAYAAQAAHAGGLITAGSRHSPQVNIVATLAEHLGMACRVHVPAGPLTPELFAAARAGAKIVAHRPGYNSVIVRRAADDAEASGWALIPFGMETVEAVTQTASQVASLPAELSRIVVPIGSGMSAAGILAGLAQAGRDVPVLGVQVGAEPRRRLDRYAPGWAERLTLTPADRPYGVAAEYNALGDLDLDPYYEAKCLPLLTPGDLLWVVGRRASASTVRRPFPQRAVL